MQPPPYPSYPHQPALPPAPQRAPLNGLAVAALVAGLLCMVPVVGVVLGAIALVQIRRTGARGKGMAVTGLVLSAVGTLLGAVVLAGGTAAIVKGFKEGVSLGARDDDGAFLRRGACVDDGTGTAPVTGVKPVPCTWQHTAEVVGTFRMPGAGGYPGDTVVRKDAVDRCMRLADGYAMDSWAVPADVDVYYYAPDRDAWNDGGRAVICLLRKENGTLTNSLRNDAMDAHQFAYLKAANVHNEAMAMGPEEENVEEDLEGYRAWAGEVAVALDTQIRTLEAHQWPAGTAEPVAALVAEVRKARVEWAEAAAATDVDAFYKHYEAADSHNGYEEAVSARSALGLATTDAAANPAA
ncbi:DUF4190 domain-containing protein [Streptomyces sp. ME02-6991-2B]|nr:DUF4190 domain-containing protein [Streptomyces sp. ME02-6991-2B]